MTPACPNGFEKPLSRPDDGTRNLPTFTTGMNLLGGARGANGALVRTMAPVRRRRYGAQPAGDDGIVASLTADFSFVGVAGRRLRLGQWHTRAQEARPLVLLNGIGMNMELMEPVARALPCRRVISFDMPGIGKSPDPIIPYTMPCMALTLAALLDRLHLDVVDVLGISWGAVRAVRLSAPRAHRPPGAGGNGSRGGDGAGQPRDPEPHGRSA
jgi:pimeloyl-ACP methyl ester carboxylesterase